MLHKKIFVITILFSFIFSGSCFAQTLDFYFNEGLRLESLPNEKKALEQYQLAVKSSPYSLKALYKCSELCARIGSREKNESRRDAFFNAALSYAKIAIKYHKNTDDANVAMSIAMGKIALTKSGKDKISFVKDIKYYADQALKINPKNFKAWHILGKWNYEIANLNFFEEAAVNLLYGGLPDASFKNAVYAYEKARSLNPKFCLNYLELAKCYKKIGNNPMALQLLQQLLVIPIGTEDDSIIKQEARELIKNWN